MAPRRSTVKDDPGDLRRYLEEVRAVPLLTAADEDELSTAIREAQAAGPDERAHGEESGHGGQPQAREHGHACGRHGERGQKLDEGALLHSTSARSCRYRERAPKVPIRE